ncbi:hypothetical protein CO731_04834 [Aminobacter sp. MSH1]|uniref:hypothetical protein n=1 Tax=Aminobacter sp. MSH1 TaxID=374606 RepID=UPI000D3B0C0C|nr:hypothetical protein [Aminobacter sp. MSH1]AWC25339.1 hypothetical protein CO731_04834 [Aminobacter sp. MSH1]
MPEEPEKPNVETVGSYPEKDAKSYGYDAIEGTLGSVPIVGAGLQKLVQSLGYDPYRKREQEFVERLGRIVAQLQQRDQLDVEALRDNPYFEGLINDIRDKFRTARSEAKKDLLVNAAANTIAGITVDDALAGRLLSLLEQFSPGHVLVLKFLHDPTANPYARKKAETLSMGALSHMVEAAFPNGEMAGNTISVIYADLEREKLVEGGLHVMMSGSGLMSKRTTVVGDAFLRFVTPNC